MGSTGFEYGIVSVCVVFYAGKFGLLAVKKKSHKKFFFFFFLSVVSTVILDLIYIVNEAPSDNVIRLCMIWSVIGPVIDIIFIDMWPGPGSLCLFIAQTIFILRVGIDVVSAFNVMGGIIWILSLLTFVFGLILKKNILEIFYPSIGMISEKSL